MNKYKPNEQMTYIREQGKKGAKQADAMEVEAI